ncbi:dTDP-4-dehydrorhamnose 3,5-epimerase [Parasutterella secunda]|uniref:dTDP-4-dehydrorhamnose 3,5-epimerase n=1 Tax=Parasutterella secunda TaxID=626947 RepID=UPI0025A3CC88|nr:dTDP-4-dehydrorhamnose 3,5-epimerase [Parasutterella secunda]MDM8225630.1 dTDP-4-dehydrorhamnose 3,5-epimerase [Parasutterella secunda]
MPIKVEKTSLAEVLIVEPQVFGDSRGFFMESWNKRDFSQITDIIFVQDNQSRSKKGVVRGLHFQLPPHAQAKLVRCVVGSIFDVAVDIRRSSPTFGQWVGVELSAENKKQLWIPEGFAHGFVALTDYAEVFYKTNEYWHKESEGSIRWDDPTLNIQWPLDVNPCLSEKDAVAPFFKDAILFD